MSSLQFLGQFVRDPVGLGAVAPSGPQLARIEVDAADIQPHHVVVELGAGTGPMTAEIVQRPHAAFVSLEPNPALAATLRDRFPEVTVDERYAQALPDIVAELGLSQVDRVVSSLPWAIWSQQLQDEIFAAILEVLAPDGRLVTFSYLHAKPLPAARRFRATLDAHFATVRTTQVAWLNVPPAFVFVCDGPRSA
jgi:phospholipid N-methyltransferase